MNIITRGLGLISRLISRGYGTASQSANVTLTGLSLTIDISSVTISASSETLLNFGGGGASVKLEWQSQVANPKLLGIPLFIKLNSVIVTTGSISETDQEEEEIVMALIASLNMPQAKNADNDMEVFNVIKLINDLLNVKNTKNK